MRGKIIQYDGASGNGIIMADGQQIRFGISAWQASQAPAVGRTVDVVAAGDQASAVMHVPDEVLLKEKAAEIGGRLGGLAGRLASGAAAATAGATAGVADGGGRASTAGSAMDRYGKLMIGAVVVFVLATLFFNAISMSMLGQSRGWSLFDIAGFMSQLGGGGGTVKFLLLLAYAGVALPMIWTDRRGWLGLCLPLLAVLWAFGSVIRAARSMGSMGGGMGEAFSELFSVGLGLYLAPVAAIVLCVGGLRRFLRSA